MTFSIVARSADGTAHGVAVASKFLAVGAAVPAAAAGVGAIATQSYANLAYRPQGLALLETGVPAGGVVAGLTAAGVNLGTGTLALQVAPRGEAAAYLATNALVSGMAAAIAPVLAGLSADWLNTQRFTVTIQWSSTWGRELALAVRPLDFHGLDFLWAASVVIARSMRSSSDRPRPIRRSSAWIS